MTTATPQTTTSYRVRIVVDDDYFPDSWDFIAKTEEEYEDNPSFATKEDYENAKRIPWETYRRTWGDPDNYVQFGFILEEVQSCVCCGSEVDDDVLDSLWGCQFYLYDEEPFPQPGIYTLDEIFDPSRREFEHVRWSLDFPDEVKQQYRTQEA